MREPRKAKFLSRAKFAQLRFLVFLRSLSDFRDYCGIGPG